MKQRLMFEIGAFCKLVHFLLQRFASKIINLESRLGKLFILLYAPLIFRPSPAPDLLRGEDHPEHDHERRPGTDRRPGER